MRCHIIVSLELIDFVESRAGLGKYAGAGCVSTGVKKIAQSPQLLREGY
jgi:hypothetical protein